MTESYPFSYHPSITMEEFLSALAADLARLSATQRKRRIRHMQRNGGHLISFRETIEWISLSQSVSPQRAFEMLRERLADGSLPAINSNTGEYEPPSTFRDAEH